MGLVVAALVGCSSGSQKNPTDGGGTAGRSGTVGAGGGGQPSATGGDSGLGGAPSAATDTNPANPHVTNMPPSSPNGPTVTVSLGVGASQAPAQAAVLPGGRAARRGARPAV